MRTQPCPQEEWPCAQPSWSSGPPFQAPSLQQIEVMDLLKVSGSAVKAGCAEIPERLDAFQLCIYATRPAGAKQSQALTCSCFC